MPTRTTSERPGRAGCDSGRVGRRRSVRRVSAKAGTGVDELLEAVLLQAEVLELTARRRPRAVVSWSSRAWTGPRSGGHRAGSGRYPASGRHGPGRRQLRPRARHARRERQAIREAGPSIPVEILGLDGTPDAGDEMTVVADEKKAREVALFRQGKFREVKLARAHAGKLENIFENMGQEEKTLNIVLKADVRGSLEACRARSAAWATTKCRCVWSVAASVVSPNPMPTWRWPPTRCCSASTCVPMPVRARSSRPKAWTCVTTT